MADLLTKIPGFEPLRVNRFILRFPSSLGINEWYVSSAKRPSAKIGTVKVDFLNSHANVAGKYSWESISVTFRDPIGPSASQALMEWFRLHAESVSGRMGYAVSYKKNVDLEMLDPTGVVVQKWVLEGCFLSGLNFGDLDYSREELASITADIVMDKAILVY